MNFIKWVIKDQYDVGSKGGTRQFFYENMSTTLEWNLVNFFKDQSTITIISVLRGYPTIRWEPNSDVFFLFKDHIIKLLQQRQAVLMIDNSVEGHSEFEVPIIQSLYFSCAKYNIDPDLIFLVTGNFRSDTLSAAYAHFNKIPKIINCIGINGCESQVILKNNIESNIEAVKMKCYTTDSDKILLSLSRRSRLFRVLAQYMIYNSKFYNKTIMSQDKVELPTVRSRAFLDLDNIVDFSKGETFIQQLPIRADESNFGYNYAPDLNADLYHNTIFSLALETNQESWDDSAYFWSEKPFKAILNFQPVLIFGQPGCNNGIREFGYKSYDQYFNLDFDFEPNPVKRLHLIIRELDKIIEHLSKLSRNKQMHWRFQHQDLLQYNFNVFFEQKYWRRKLEEMIRTMGSVLSNENKLYWRKY